MSEFCESIYLGSDSERDGIELLRSARVAGCVLPPKSGWLQIAYENSLTRTGTNEGLGRIIAANRGRLIHYVFAEDHGCSLHLYDNALCVSRLDASFEGGRTRFERAAFVRLGLLTEAAADEVARWLAGDEQLGPEPDHTIARAIGLPRRQITTPETRRNIAFENTQHELAELGHEIDALADSQLKELLGAIPNDELDGLMDAVRRGLPGDAGPESAAAKRIDRISRLAGRERS
ncbi:MAG: hypothetical protein H6729_06425 [Deltaproteobacteria bacterium]|nr:hypothetical protein [Deltaproteobacteria bacterium]